MTSSRLALDRARRSRPRRALRRERASCPQPIDGRDRGALGRGARRDGERDVLPRPGRGAGAARVARRARDRRGRRVVPGLDLVPGPLGREGGAGDADPGARPGARARGAGLRRRARPGRRRARARRSAAPPRRCSAGSVRRRTSPTRSPILAGAGFVTGTTLVVDGGRSLKSGAGRDPVEALSGDGDPTPYDATRDQRRRADPARGDRRPVGVRGSLPPLCAAGLRARPAAARRSRPRRGRSAGDVRVDLALRRLVPAGARPRRAVALRRRAERDRRPRARAHRYAGGDSRRSRRARPARPTAPSRAGSPGACTARSKSCRSASAR